MGNKNTNNLRESVLENDTLNNNNNHNEDECTEKQRGVWTHDRDLIYMKRLVECYPPSQGRGNTAKAWKDLQAAVNSIDQDQGQLQKTTVKSRGAVLIDEYLKRKKIQQESTGTSGDYTNLDRWIRKHLTMLRSIAEKKRKGKGKGKEPENAEKLSEEHPCTESSALGKRLAIIDNENAKRAKVISINERMPHNSNFSLEQNLNIKILEQLTRHTEAVTELTETLTKTLENGFQNLNETLDRLTYVMTAAAPPSRHRPIAPTPIQKKKS